MSGFIDEMVSDLKHVNSSSDQNAMCLTDRFNQSCKLKSMLRDSYSYKMPFPFNLEAKEPWRERNIWEQLICTGTLHSEQIRLVFFCFFNLPHYPHLLCIGAVVIYTISSHLGGNSVPEIGLPSARSCLCLFRYTLTMSRLKAS